MNESRKAYETPRLAEVGNIEKITKELGWGWHELLASIVTGNNISVGWCKGGWQECFS
jgi:hypothetical protein